MSQFYKTFKSVVTVTSGLTDKLSAINYKIKNLKTSQIQNDSGYTTSGYVNELVSGTSEYIMGNVSNLSGFTYKEFKKRPIDITSFRVYANDTAIPVGFSSELSGTVNVEIPAGMTHKMIVRTNSDQDDQSDVYIDWGDDTISYISKQEYEKKEIDKSDNVHPYKYTVSHTYTTKGFYDVKIYGKKYFTVYGITGYNLISNCFDTQHDIASHVKNTASFCIDAKRLLNVAVPVYSNVWNVINWANCFLNCVNLISATGFEQFIRQINTISNMFEGCKNMITCDLLCQEDSACKRTFYGCTVLTADIYKFLPYKMGGFNRRNINISETFRGCPNLTMSHYDDVADILWNDLGMSFTYTSAFIDCSDEVRSHVPSSWGGTMVQKTIDEQLQDVIKNLEQI